MKKSMHKRTMVQSIFFIVAIGVTINHMLLEAGKGISWLSSGYIHYVCPICGVTTIYQYFASSLDWSTKLQNPVSYVIIGSIITAIIAGPIFCGWICPFGTFQDIVGELLGTKIFKKKYNKIINQRIDSKLRWLRYVSLLVVIYMMAKSATAMLESINPYHALLDLFLGEFALIGLVVLAVVVVASLIIQRPWCKYLCPYGAFLGLFNIFRIKAIVREPTTCINCKKCDRSCPMNIEVSKSRVVRNHQCISCMQCTSNDTCPIDESLTLKGTKGIYERVEVNFKNVASFSTALIALLVIGSTIALNRGESSAEEVDFIIENTLEGNYESGTYTGVSTGFNAGLTVEIVIEDNQITDLTITDHSETIGYYEVAFDAVPTSILTEQTTEVDVVSGATKSSEGIIEAVEMALKSAESASDSTDTVVELVVPETAIADEEITPPTTTELTATAEVTATETISDLVGVEMVAMSSVTDIKVEPSGDYADGVYEGTAQGYGGDVTTEITIEDGYVVKVEVVDHNETSVFFETTIEMLESMIESQSAEVDVVSGATLSSNAIIEGAKEALSAAE